MKAGAKMKVLFATDSVFQLIIAVNLRLTVYKDADADIIIYNSTNNADTYCENLKKTGIFSRCWCAKTPLTYCGNSYSTKEKLPKYFIYLKSLLWPEACIKKILGESLAYYDHFIFNGTGALPDCIFNVCQSFNPAIKCFRIEDGYVSYTEEYGKIKGKLRERLERLAAGASNRKYLSDNVYGYYLTAPELVCFEYPYPVLPTPKFSRVNTQLVEILNRTFGYTGVEDDYHEKYIFFECGDAFFNNNNEDVAYVQRLAELVGGENILVKLHPRSKVNRFADLGIHTAHSSTVPWELIQLNNRFEGKVFVTTKSSAVLSSKVYFDDNCDAVLVYKGIKSEQIGAGEAFEKSIEKFKNNTNGFWTPQSVEEFADVIKVIEGKNRVDL